MGEDSRKALREFYRLQEASNQPEPEPEFSLSTEQDDFTELEELDAENVDIHEFVDKTIRDHGLAHLVATIGQISRERNALASSQRELVNDNYKKLIQAAETLGYLSSQGDLAGLEELSKPVHELSGLLAEMPQETPTDETKFNELRAELEKCQKA